MEHWKAVPGWAGLYEVSDLGRVRSLDRTVITRRHGPTRYRGRVLLATITSNGYPVVALTKPGQKPLCCNVHSLVLRTFVGEPPPGHECCHGDGDRTNNALRNLRWDTRSANSFDMDLHGTRVVKRGEAAAAAKLTADAVRWIRQNAAAFGLRATGRKYGVTHGTVRQVLCGTTWGHVE